MTNRISLNSLRLLLAVTFSLSASQAVLADYKFSSIDTSKLGSPYANSNAPIGSYSAPTQVNTTTLPLNTGAGSSVTGATNGARSSSILPSGSSPGTTSNAPASVAPGSPSYATTQSEYPDPESAPSGAEPPTVSTNAPAESQSSPTMTKAKKVWGQAGKLFNKMTAPPQQTGAVPPNAQYVPYIPGVPYSQVGAGAANSIINGVMNSAPSNASSDYKPLTPGPSADLQPAPGVAIQNTGTALPDYNSPKRPGKAWSPWGKSIDESVNESAWQRAKQRDAQGLSGIAPTQDPAPNPASAYTPSSAAAGPAATASAVYGSAPQPAHSSRSSNSRLPATTRSADTPPVPEDKEPKTPEEMARLGYWYWKNWRVSKLPLAVELMTKAAEAGEPRAQCILADWYERGIRETLQRDESKTYYWYSKAAAQNQRVALTYMGLRYSDGKDCPKDLGKAFGYFQKAADQHYAPAEMAVAQSYCSGEGVTENRAKAIEWFEKAQADGSNTAKDFLEILRLPHCPGHFNSLQDLLAYGTRYQGLQASRNIAQSQEAVGRVKMYQNTPGSTEYRLGRQIYNNGRQNEDNASGTLNSQF